MVLIRDIMGMTIFGVGVVAIALGMVIILGKEYQETLRVLSSHSTRLSGRAITEEGMAPVLDGMARLLDAVTRLIATAVGVGAFLALLGVGMSVVGFWMLSK